MIGGNLLQRFVALPQFCGDGLGNLPVDDVLWRLTAHSVAHLGQVGSRDVEAIGIESHVAVGAEVIGNEGQKTVEKLCTNALRPGFGLHPTDHEFARLAFGSAHIITERHKSGNG